MSYYVTYTDSAKSIGSQFATIVVNVGGSSKESVEQQYPTRNPGMPAIPIW